MGDGWRLGRRWLIRVPHIDEPGGIDRGLATLRTVEEPGGLVR